MDQQSFISIEPYQFNSSILAKCFCEMYKGVTTQGLPRFNMVRKLRHELDAHINTLIKRV